MSSTGSNISIYSLSDDLRALYEAIYDNDGELTEELESSLSELTEDKIPKKLMGVGAILRKIDGDIESFKEEKRMLDNKMKHFQKVEEKLKNRVHQLLNIMETDKVSTNTGTFYRRTSSPIEIEDVESLPKELYTYKKSPVPKSDIKKYIEEHGEIPKGVRVSEKEHIVYKKANTK